MASITDLVGIKTQIKSILDSANTTTASPIDLSSNLATRINRVMTVHPERIMPQASFFPLVTTYIDNKDIESEDMASSQLNSKRIARVGIKVVGAIFNQNMLSVDKDPADDDINYLMENIELIFRGNYNLNSTVSWQMADRINYYISSIDEQTHLRFGILDLSAKVFY